MSPPPSDPSGDSAAQSVPKARTLPPPEWTEREGPRSAASLALEMHAADPPISRRLGPRAERSYYQARAAAAAAAGDAEGERAAAAALARTLATRGAELDTATKLARRALVLGDDPVLREELAGWFAMLGEPPLAAATLRPLVNDQRGAPAAQTLTRIAVYLGRAGDAAAAADALAQATREDPNDPVPPELLAGLGAWAPYAVSAERAAAAYVDGYRRREARGERAAAFEDLLRAFEMAPGEAEPAELLARALASRGRVGAADEVRREHARAVSDGGRAAHMLRMRAFFESGDLARAVGAALDARLDAELDAEQIAREQLAPEGADHSLEHLLERTGLHELYAARLELACEALAAPERSRLRGVLARLYGGALASPARASESWIDALVADPNSEEAKAALRSHATTARDSAPLVEALVRVGKTARGPARAACLRELALLADQRLEDPGLAAWAVEQLKSEGPSSELDTLIERIAARKRRQDEELARARAELAETSGAARLALLRRVASILRGRPDEVDACIAALVEIADADPDERAWQQNLERVLVREGRAADLDALLRRALSRTTAGAERERLRLELSKLHRAAQDLDGALRELMPLFEDGGNHPAAWSMALLLAASLGDETVRAEALLRIAQPLSPSLRAIVTSCAAESWLLAGDLGRARSAAEQASHVDPSLTRPVAVLSQIALLSGPTAEAAVALERAMGIVVPRASLAEALAEAHEALGQPELSLMWTQRWLALRPGDPRAAKTLLGRVTESGEAQRLGDALAWLLAQPQPLRPMAREIGAALLRLAELDRERGATMARRALDVLGPRATELRDVLLAISDAAGQPGLGIAVAERALAAGTQGADRAELLLEVAARRRAAGDADGAAGAIARAIVEGAAPARVLEELSHALPARSSDGEISLLEARAEALSALAGADPAGAARAWRELGAARWDLAGDSAGALRAWERAAALDPDRGLQRLARDIVAFGGHAAALAHLKQLAAQRRDKADAARVLAIAATVALGAGETREAIRIAANALELDGSRTDVLAIAERAAGGEDVELLEHIYDGLSDAALGIYGERAVHYRAGRVLERRGETERALKHAVRAFEAVPAEGVALVLMSRLADRTGMAAEVVASLERVAGRASSATERSAWLERAAALASDGEEGRRQRVDVLLRALSVLPDARTLEKLGAALAELITIAPEYREIAELRLERALSALLPRLDGPEGARTALAAARVAIEVLERPRLALVALDRALSADADLEEFATLLPRATALAAEREAAGKLVARTAAMLDNRYANAGRSALELAARIALALGDRAARARLLVAAAAKDTDDAALVREAADAARVASDPDLVEKISEIAPAIDRSAGLAELAERAEQSGDLVRAIEVRERLHADPKASEEARAAESLRLRDLYARTGKRAELEKLLSSELDRPGVAAEAQLRLTRDLAAVVAARGDADRALDILERQIKAHPDNVELVNDAVTLARQASDKKRLAEALGRLADLSSGEEKLALLRELAPLLEEIGLGDRASQRWAELLAIEPNDVGALAALERDAEARGDYDTVVGLLGRRASLATRVDEVRRIRLRRATVLEQRLGRADEARSELEALLAATGDTLSVLRVLADLDQRLGDSLRAAPLWLRASAITTDKREAADLAQRACEAYLGGGDVAAARRVLEGMETWAHSGSVLELRVEVERRGEDPRGLALALEDLANHEGVEPSRRARLLVEAARAYHAAGDSESAVERARRAARLAPDAAEPQLCARWLEYLVRGPGSADEARLSAAELRRIHGELEPEQAELRAFLVSEALDVALGSGAGMRELSRANSELGSRPLIALGMAERLADGGEPARALSLFETALAGDLRSLRTRGEVALAAARAARAAKELDRALGYVETAATEEATRADALSLGAELRDALAERRGAAGAAAPEPALPHLSLTPPTRRSDSKPPPSAARRASPPMGVPSATPVTTRSEPPIVERPVRRSEPPIPREEPGGRPVLVEHTPAAPPTRAPSSPPPRPSSWPGAVVEIGPEPRLSHVAFRPASGAEETLMDALARGSIEAGQELMRQLENRSDRSQDLVNVCRRVVALLPGNRDALVRLYEAALADKNLVYARSVEHVLKSFEPGMEPVVPPPLADQPESSDVVRGMLLRDTTSAATEALALVWEGAGHVFRRDPGTYGVTGLERVPIGAPTPLARAYSAAARMLGMRTPFFQRRSAGPVTLSIALLSPPAVIVSGEVLRESAQLRFHVGAMLGAAMPEHALLFGSVESQVRGILKALALAFGPPQESKSGLTSIANLAEVLWESIPTRSQRRLRELCDDPRQLDYDLAMSAARRAVRRAGLLSCGDVKVALRETCGEEGIALSALEEAGGLAALCSASPAVADVVRLATSLEYAEARWQPSRGGGPRPSSGTWGSP